MHERALFTIAVECYAGHRGDETPRAIRLGDRRVAVAELLDRWLAPDHRYFKLRGDDGDIYIIRHDVESGQWELTMFQAGRTAGAEPRTGRDIE
jgi:hypothetical protein